jgi:hypothetical protein
MPSASDYTTYLKYAATYAVSSNITAPNRSKGQLTPYAGALGANVRTSEMSRLVGSPISTLTGTGARVMPTNFPPVRNNPDARSILTWYH